MFKKILLGFGVLCTILLSAGVSAQDLSNPSAASPFNYDGVDGWVPIVSTYTIGSSGTPFLSGFFTNLTVTNLSIGSINFGFDEGSIGFGDSSGNLVENNAQIAWDTAALILGLGGEVEFNVDSLGDTTGGRVLSDLNSDALIQFGEYSLDDIAITADDGGFVKGALWINSGDARLSYNTTTVFVDPNRIQLQPTLTDTLVTVDTSKVEIGKLGFNTILIGPTAGVEVRDKLLVNTAASTQSARFHVEGTTGDTASTYSGPPKASFGTTGQGFIISTIPNSFTSFNNDAFGFSQGLGLMGFTESDNTDDIIGGVYGAALSSHIAGTKTLVSGVEGDAFSEGAGTITNFSGVSGLASADGTGGTVTNMASLLAQSNFTSAGTVTNNIGLHIQDQTGVGTNNYQILSKGTGDFAVFPDGSVTIDTLVSAQDAKLHVKGDVGNGSWTYSGPDKSDFSVFGQGFLTTSSPNLFTAIDNATGANIGLNLMGIYEDSTTISTPIAGVYGAVISTHNAGTKGNVMGVKGDVYTDDLTSGDITNFSGVRGFAGHSGGGTVTNMASLFGEKNINTGTVTNNVGLYLQDQTGIGTNNFQILSDAATDFVVLPNANVGIGTRDQFGATIAGANVVGLQNAATVPTGLVTTGGVLYSTGAPSELHWLQSDGTDIEVSAVQAAETLAQTLTAGNTSGGTNIVLSDADTIKGTSNAHMNFRQDDIANSIYIGSDAAGDFSESFLFMDSSTTDILGFDTANIDTTDNHIKLNASANQITLLNDASSPLDNSVVLLRTRGRLDVQGSISTNNIAGSVLTGSIDPTASTTVVGVGTDFQRELRIGDRITVSGETRTVVALSNPLGLTVDVAFSDNANDTTPDKLPLEFVLLDSADVIDFIVQDNGNVGIAGSTEFGATTAGVGVIGIDNASTVPTGTLTAGGVLYSTGTPSELHWLQSDGTDVDLTAGGAAETLAQTLVAGNTSGANDLIMTAGQKVTTDTIDETTAAAGVTIDSVLLKDNEVKLADDKYLILKTDSTLSFGYNSDVDSAHFKSTGTTFLTSTGNLEIVSNTADDATGTFGPQIVMQAQGMLLDASDAATNKTIQLKGTDGVRFNSTATAIYAEVDTDNLTANRIFVFPDTAGTFALTGSTLANIVEDITPQLGAQLDVNSFGLGDGTLELLSFIETASAVNEVTITNAATAGDPDISATGGDTDINLSFTPKGAGFSTFAGRIELTGLGGSVFIGVDAGLNDDLTTNFNTFVGADAGKANVTGASNTFIGESAGETNISGPNNTFVGNLAGRDNTDFANTFVGQATGILNSTGASNSFFGRAAGGVNTSGDGNVFIGAAAGGNNTTGSKNIVLGDGVSVPIATGDDQLTIGNIIFGTGVDGIGTTVSTGNVGIKTATPGATLEVNGTLAFTPSATNVLVAGTALTVSNHIMRIDSGAAGAVTMTATPTIVDGADGECVIIQGDDDTNTILFQDEAQLANTGLQMAGDANFLFGAGDTLHLCYDLGDDNWYEISRSNN